MLSLKDRRNEQKKNKKPKEDLLLTHSKFL